MHITILISEFVQKLNFLNNPIIYLEDYYPSRQGENKASQDKRIEIFVPFFGRISGALRRKPGYPLLIRNPRPLGRGFL
ncbi:MAG: hypothetical protein LBD65_01515, partial [Spirochaetaceae bacterium]|nr:hypothetical protein [Spirochaetaceae bacterium]